jgi:hypothetical protein
VVCSQTKELHKIGSKAEEESFKRFVYQRMDLNTMEGKVQASRYKCLEEFYADAQIVLHNCVLVYGSQCTFLSFSFFARMSC